jgi:hypothetical protein
MKIDDVKHVKDLYEDRLMALDCVQGVGIRQAGGEPVIAVYVDSSGDKQHAGIPQTLDDVPVVVEESGVFNAY